MLTAMRNTFATGIMRWVLIAMMGLLIVSFGIWGIGDIFRASSQQDVATIGSTRISAEDFRQRFNDRLQQISRQLGRPVTPDQARAIGFDRQLLQELVTQATLDEQARKLGLGLSDDAVRRRIMSETAFHGPGGQFDSLTFQRMIRAAGYTEQRFVDEQRRVSVRRQISEPVAHPLPVPSVVIEALHRYETETRSFDVIRLTRETAGEIPAPTDADIARYFEERKAVFRAPEYRKLVVLTVGTAEVTLAAAVTDEEIAAAYEQRRAQFTLPEQRTVIQIAYPSEAEAKAAADRAAAGTDFATLLAERNIPVADATLGPWPRDRFTDPAVGNAAFAAAEGAVTPPVRGRFGFVVLRVAKVEPARLRPLDEVREELRTQLSAAKARQEIERLHDAIEEARGGGTRLAEIAQKENLVVTEIDAVDRSGRTPGGVEVTGLPNARQIVENAFAADVGVEIDPQRLPGGGWLWYEVDGITPPRERPLEEVREEVVARLTAQRLSERLAARSTEMVERIRTGTAIAEVAAGAGLTVQRVTGVTRTAPGGLETSTAVDEGFRLAVGGASTGAATTEPDRLVFVLVEATVPPLDPAGEVVKRYREQLAQSYEGDVSDQFIRRLQADIGLTVNQAALTQALGTGGAN